MFLHFWMHHTASSGKFYRNPNLPSWALLPLWNWLSTPLPPWLSVHIRRPAGCCTMPSLSPWTVLWQTWIVGLLRCSPMSCRVRHINRIPFCVYPYIHIQYTHVKYISFWYNANHFQAGWSRICEICKFTPLPCPQVRVSGWQLHSHPSWWISWLPLPCRLQVSCWLWQRSTMWVWHL